MIARRAITRGNIDRIRLKASPAALFHDQSLLNLAQNSWKGFVFLSSVLRILEILWCFWLPGCLAVSVAISIPHRDESSAKISTGGSDERRLLLTSGE